MKFLSFENIDIAEWDSLVIRSPDGWPFALSGWRKLILAVSEWRLQDHSFGIIEDGRLVAAVPLQFNLNSRIVSSTGWGGCGPIVARERCGHDSDFLIEAAIEKMDSIAQSLNANSLEFWRLPVVESAMTNLHPPAKYPRGGLEDFSGTSQVIDLTKSELDLLAGLSENARRKIRKAEKANLTVRLADWGAALDAYYNIHEETYRRTGVPPHPKSYFKGIADQMAPAGYSVLWTALDSDGSPIAFHISMRFGQGAWYHTGCSTSAGLESGANYLLFWKSIIGAKAAGLLKYDCGEIFDETVRGKSRGLTAFKTRFGGETYRFPKFKKDYQRDTADTHFLLRFIANKARRILRRSAQ